MPVDPFDCTIRFTGLCAFVPNKAFGENPERMCVVLVDGRQEGTKGLDGTPMRRHLAFIRFDLRNLPSGAGFTRKHHGVWYMEDQRIVIDTDGAALDTTSYVPGIDANHSIDAPTAGEEESCSWIAGLTKLMPDYSGLDSNCVSTKDMTSPVPASVLAQIFFDKGKLTVKRPAAQVWSFPGTLSAQHTRQPFTQEAILTLRGVTKLKFSARALPRTGAQDDALELVPGSVGSVDITIANLCDDNPLQWPRGSRRRDDEDFKWYYQLMTSTQRYVMNGRRRGAPAPTPLWERKESPAATGVNCFPIRTAHIPFDMP